MIRFLFLENKKICNSYLQAALTALATMLTLSKNFSLIYVWEIENDRVLFTEIYSIISNCNGVIISTTHLDQRQDIWWGLLQIPLRFIPK